MEKVGELVGITEIDLKGLLLQKSASWSTIDGMITSRCNKFGANAAAEFEVNLVDAIIVSIILTLYYRKWFVL